MLMNVREGDKVDSLLTLKRKTDVNGRPCMNKWCPDSESNQGHGDFQSPALPTELSGQRPALNRKAPYASMGLSQIGCIGWRTAHFIYTTG